MAPTPAPALKVGFNDRVPLLQLSVMTLQNIFAVTGDLTIKGITRPITVEFVYTGSAVDPYGNTRIGFEGISTINRSDFGINFNATLETGGVLVSDKITLEFDISAIKAQ